DLNASRDRAEMERVRLSPKRDKAERRAKLLRDLFLHRDDVLNMVQIIPLADGKPKQKLEEWMPGLYAATLLGLPDTPPRAGVEIDSGQWLAECLNDFGDTWPEMPYRHLYMIEDDGTREYAFDEVRTDFVVYYLLARMAFKPMRRLLRDLDVSVLVKYPRTK